MESKGASRPESKQIEVSVINHEPSMRNVLVEALQDSEKRYRLLAENVADVIWTTDLNLNPAYVSPSVTRLAGYSVEETMAKTIDELLTPASVELAKKTVREEIAIENMEQKDPSRSRTLELEINCKDGSNTLIEVRIAFLRDPDGVPVGILGIARDITERKQIEERLRESEAKYRGVVENISDLVFTADVEGNVLFASPSAKKFTGYEPEETIGHNFREYVHPDDVPTLFASIQQVLSGGSTQSIKGVDEDLEFRMVKKDGDVIWVTGRSHPNRDKEGEIVSFSGVLRDITDRNRAEEEKERIAAQLLQAQRMEAIGALAGGVAHDFNNLLTAIHGYANMALEAVDETHPLHRYLKRIDAACSRAAGLTRQLLLFGRKQPMEFTFLNINEIVEDLLKMLKRLIGENIAVITCLEPDILTVRGDSGNIEQVIMNLAVNARDAMPDGGKLTITTADVTLAEEQCKAIPEARPGRYVCLSVADTGVGIDKAVIQHIFEPFFSTKEPGEGTGLGLSVVYGIVKQHEGWINVYSEPGQGSTFKVYLPAVHAKPETKTEETIEKKELQGGGERILLVEDDERVRQFLTEALSENGHVVFEAASGTEALDIFDREKGKFHLVFSDVVLPDMKGSQLVDEFLCRKPELRILLSSGYTDDKLQSPVMRQRRFQLLHKPYDLTELLQAVREAMGAPQV